MFDPFHFGLSTYVRCHLYTGGFGCDKRQGQIQSMPLLRFGRVGLQCQWWESPWHDVASVTVGGSCYGLEWFGPLPGQNNRRKVVVSWLQGSPPSLVSRTRLQRRDSGEFWGMHGLLHAWSLGLWLRCSGLRSRAGFAGPA